MQLSLRTLFWLLFVAAIAVGWGWEGCQLRNEYARLHPPATPPLVIPPYPARHVLIDAISPLSDAGLIARWEAGIGGTDDWDIVVNEMARRGMRDELQRTYAHSPPDDFNSWRGKLLTVLRRMDGKPDPLAIHVQLSTTDAAGKRTGAPFIHATLENVDVEKSDVDYEAGGDYRGGRPERWRIELTDEQGRVVKDSNYPSMHMGGISSLGPMKFGEKHEFHLDARRYVAPPTTGKYSLQLIHSSDYIADEPDLAGMIVWKSQPIQVYVTNPTSADLRFPVVRFFALAALTFIVLVLFRRGLNFERQRAKSPLWRDLAAFVLILALAGGWTYDTCRLKLAIFQALPDAEAAWTMKEI